MCGVEGPGARVRRGKKLRFLCPEHLHTKEDRDKFLTRGELGHLLAAARLSGPRDLALLWICSVLGTRVSELVELRRCDFNLEQGVAWIDVRKRGKRARLGRIYTVIPPADLAPVKRWVQRFEGAAFIFPGQRGGSHMSTRAAQLVFKRCAAAAGVLAVRPKASIHALRHTRAVLLLEQTKDVQFVQKMLRHRSRASTEAYIHMLPGKFRELTDKVSLLGGGGR